jgi:hypothetical protein
MQERTAITTWTLIGALLVLLAGAGLVALLVPALYQGRVAELRAERGWTSTPEATRQARAAQAARLQGYAWVDREKGVVAVPIGRAMELALRDLQPRRDGKEGGR